MWRKLITLLQYLLRALATHTLIVLLPLSDTGTFWYLAAGSRADAAGKRLERRFHMRCAALRDSPALAGTRHTTHAETTLNTSERSDYTRIVSIVLSAHYKVRIHNFNDFFALRGEC